MLFKDFNLKGGIIKALDEMKYIEATDIQKQVIKTALDGKNIVGQSQTGTGKTAAFLIPLLQKIDTNKKGLQALILAPTRELVNQIGEEIFALTKYYRVNAACIYGGASLVTQKKLLVRGPSIVVATPGRLMDFMKQEVININTVNFFVLDEVDRMLDMGFVRDIKKIRAQMHNIQQTYTFSATINHDIKSIIKEHINEYEFIKIGEAVTVDKINHSYMSLSHESKLSNLVNLIKTHPGDKVLVFTQTKRNTKKIMDIIEKAGYKVGMLNGDMSQNKRMFTLKNFKESHIRVLVTTDVAARGLNMDNVGLVINFDVPRETESYIHRIGRTGRAGAFGKAIMLVSPEEQKLLADIEKVHRTRVKKSDHPVIGDKGEYSNIRLNKSTDKMGKAAKTSKFQGGKNNFKKPGPRKFTRDEGDGFEDKKFSDSRPKPRSFVRGKENKFGGKKSRFDEPRKSKFGDKKFAKAFDKNGYSGKDDINKEDSKFGKDKFGRGRRPKKSPQKYRKFRGIGK
ncbi:DEAD/DEAH box helicase [Candidatus Gracilibacteria bacterium]|nr:DEAD/DEAH box helicase [Candidatus Gracilibacteria bacterium]